jgi:hypothetical protein
VEGRPLRSRLAPAIRRLALSRDEINALPDPYAAAVAAKTFPTVFDPDKATSAFLPPDLWQTDGPWVVLGDGDGELATAVHTRFFGGRSTFIAFMRLPEGRSQTIRYLEKLHAWQVGGYPGRAPQVPEGTQVALARRTLLIDSQGLITPTPWTETVQIRVFQRTGPGVTAGSDRAAAPRFEIKLRRADLVAGKPSALSAVTEDDKERAFLLFMGRNAGARDERVMGSCFSCHNPPGIDSVNTYTRPFRTRPLGGGGGLANLIPSFRSTEEDRIIGWKREQFSWGLLQGLLEGSTPR